MDSRAKTQQSHAPPNAAAAQTVRAARAGDVDGILGIERVSFADPWSRRSFERLLGDRRVYFAVCCQDETVLGYVVAWFAADQGEIANLAVAPEARGGRLGSALLDAAVAEARTRGASELYLEVRDSNDTARRLYASRGFTAVGRRRNYYRRPTEDAIVLRRLLPPSPSREASRAAQPK